MRSSRGKLLAFVLALVAVQCLEGGGRVVLGLREHAEVDPTGYVVDWGGGEEDTGSCSRSTDACEDGRNKENAFQRLLVQNNSKPSDGGQELAKPKQAFPPTSSEPTMTPAPSPQILPPPAPTSPNSSPSYATSSKGSKTLIFGIIGGVVGLLVLAFIAVIIYSLRKVSVRPWAPGLSGKLKKAFVTGLPKLTRLELQTACEDFSNIVGTLSFGTVYKGTLSSGVEIAVCVIKTDEWSEQSQTHFRKKIKTLSAINHKNFVNLVGYCEDDQPFSRMLVFEYSPNGKLFEHLHTMESHDDLSWSARTRIAMGVAYCLDHMLQLSPPIIVKKLDSRFIHLTDDVAAKLADMELSGLMQFVTPDSTLVHGQENVVYLFGMLLLELISGRVSFSDENGGSLFWAAEYLNGRKPAKEAIDMAMNPVRDEDFEAVFDVVKQCLHTDPAHRPSMAQVVEKLRGITSISPEGASPRLSPLWWAELEIISRDTA